MNRQQRRALTRDLKRNAHVCTDGAYVLYSPDHGYVSGIDKQQVHFVSSEHPHAMQLFHESCGAQCAEVLTIECGIPFVLVRNPLAITQRKNQILRLHPLMLKN